MQRKEKKSRRLIRKRRQMVEEGARPKRIAKLKSTIQKNKFSEFSLSRDGESWEDNETG